MTTSRPNGSGGSTPALPGAVAEASVVYTDFGVSRGMEYGIAAARAAGLPVEMRTLAPELLAEIEAASAAPFADMPDVLAAGVKAPPASGGTYQFAVQRGAAPAPDPPQIQDPWPIRTGAAALRRAGSCGRFSLQSKRPPSARTTSARARFSA
ncbi:hypothetical protein LAZ40_09155 [Cereibacter sphaeroides]|uniref:hypothetical protein n=1 Tax=Cereibacter sphaeroides TaxID=1063 RepID=UPI001F3AA7AB|nr:hypothetical protein [Cereibacter sphaeroides]MCE6959218.1 hypothetical protein [Cereibacter sphaeroides]MCE6972021.1 hypothetical protein [Cereibacter sphaeroides]